MENQGIFFHPKSPKQRMPRAETQSGIICFWAAEGTRIDGVLLRKSMNFKIPDKTIGETFDQPLK
jgi:hypothetical protein